MGANNSRHMVVDTERQLELNLGALERTTRELEENLIELKALLAQSRKEKEELEKENAQLRAVVGLRDGRIACLEAKVSDLEGGLVEAGEEYK